MNVWTLDFETEKIDGWVPPAPVGLAVRSPSGSTEYYSWGHPDSTNKEECLSYAKDLLYRLFRDRTPVLFHNGAFDLGVAAWHWQLAPRDYSVVHDTLFLLFFHDPYAPNLSLKPSAERVLNIPPEEQDELHDWLIANVPEARAKPSDAGGYISLAPHNLVARYAIGDVDRTFLLFRHLYPIVIDEQGMGDAYRREQLLVPILHESKMRGVRIDREQLGHDLENIYEPALVKCENELRRLLKDDTLEFNKKDILADRLEEAGYVDEWILTPKGRRSVSKVNLERVINSPDVLHLLRYRGAMAGALQTFGRPWMEDSAGDGRLHTSWNQVRTRGDHGDQGTRTGRLSASRPNLMNVPNEYDIVIPEGFPTPIFMRRYMLPEEGHTWIKRDFSSQEVRIAGHFEDGDLLLAYQNNPNLDPHQMASDIIYERTGHRFPRKWIKIVFFSIIYGAGVATTAERLGVDRSTGDKIIRELFRVFPGIKDLQKEVKKIADSGGFITTWGGRRYFAEPPKLIGGTYRKFGYKVLNYLIQGSAADQTKDCIIAWNSVKKPEVIFLAAVHDEINISAPSNCAFSSMKVLKDMMDRDLLDCPMRSEGFMGPNWFDLEVHHD